MKGDLIQIIKNISFRPLSGSYISQFSVLIAILQNTLVSVPYRGATFLNIDRTFLMLQAQFPSPIGELHFSIKIFSFVSRSQRCFRPLSGSYISQLRLQVVSHGVTLVSVPYRGATFLNNRRTCSAKAVWKPFPSPIGELHFSIKSIKLDKSILVKEFPSPIGELHFSIIRKYRYQS